MKTATFKIVGVSPISFSRPFQSEKGDKESHSDFDKRCWRERCHVNGDGKVLIPAAAMKQSLDAVAKYLGIKIPGEGKKTWTQKFASGILVFDQIELGIALADVEAEPIYVNADGRRGSSTRVWRTFPTLREWSAPVIVHIAEEKITEEVFRYHLDEAGKFIGLGMHRPQNGGFKGRFKVEDFQWA